MNTHLIAILHDMMKPNTYKEREGRDTYYGHENIDEKLLNDLKKDLVLTNKEVKFLRYVVKCHHLFKMANIDNKKSIFNVAFEMRKDLEFFEKIKPILYGDFFNGIMNKEKEMEFNNKFYTVEKAIRRIDVINEGYNWGKLTSEILDKKNISDKIRKILKKHFVSDYITERELNSLLKG